MKAFLTNGSCVVPLAGRATTIGREACDLHVQGYGVEKRHAVIQYSEQEQCYVLQDLGSSAGTFVNECRVHVASVRLTHGDIVRFGTRANQFTFKTDEMSTTGSAPRIEDVSKPAWAGSLTVINSVTPSYGCGLNSTGSEHTQSTTRQNRVINHGCRSNLFRQRPMSAGGMRTDRPVATLSAGSIGIRQSNGWVNGSKPSDDGHLVLLQEKEQKIMQLSEEVARLKTVEHESSEKDSTVRKLQEDLTCKDRALQEALNNSRLISGSGSELSARLHQLETELVGKRQEITQLRSQLEYEQTHRPATVNMSQESRRMRGDLERMSKDKSIISGLVTRLQSDMNTKDTTIGRLSREIESLKKELKARENENASLNLKIGKLQGSKVSMEDFESKEQEMETVKQKLRIAEGKVNELRKNTTNLKRELETMTKERDDCKWKSDDATKKLEKEKNKCLDIERAERMVRVDLEQAIAQAERFRRRVSQTMYSTPGVKAPDPDETQTDDMLMSKLRELIDERTSIHQKLRDWQDSHKQEDKDKKKYKESLKKLKDCLNNSNSRLNNKARVSSVLKHEATLLSSVVLDDQLVFARDLAAAQLTAEAAEVEALEASLETAGVNVKLSDQPLTSHIKSLHTKLSSALDTQKQLSDKLNTAESRAQQEITHRVASITTEWQQRLAEAVEQAKLQGDERLNTAIEELKSVEAERREVAVSVERSRTEELMETVARLRKNLVEKEEELVSNRQQTKEALESLEEYKKLEEELKESLETVQTDASVKQQETLRKLKEEAVEHEHQINMYTEQIKQHSVTVCSLEDKLSKVQKLNAELQSQLSSSKAQVTELRHRPEPRPQPPPTPKPQIVVHKPPPADVVAMQQQIDSITDENSGHIRHIRELDEQIISLKKELESSTARLSDVKDEVAESCKRQLDKARAATRDKEARLLEARQQITRLSQLTDKLKNEQRQNTNQITKLQSNITKLKKQLTQKQEELTSALLTLESEQHKFSSSLKQEEEEGRISRELTAQGAQCRGDRHEQTIERQREALADLRSRLRTLEQKNPAPPSKETALQEVLLLKRQLAEMKAEQALNSDPTTRSLISGSVEHQVSRARGANSANELETDMERAAHRETTDALHKSEKNFIDVLSGLAAAVGIDCSLAVRSMTHVTPDERKRIQANRDAIVSEMTSRISALQERIQRKDQLLQGYEQDLAKLRQAEEITRKRDRQIAAMSQDVRSRTEESVYLRESLLRARDKLDDEKRLNSAIKQKRPITRDVITRPSSAKAPGSARGGSVSMSRPGSARVRTDVAQEFSKRRAHHCAPDDSVAKAFAARKREQADRRKRYTIETLKRELTEKEEQLDTAHRRLETINAQMGGMLSDGEDMFE